MSSNLVMEIVEGLNIPKEILEELRKPRTNEDFKVFILSIPDILYPDTFKLAGRLMLYITARKSPKDIKDYVDILNYILSDDIKKYMLDNSENINELLSNTFSYNYMDFDLLSANSCLNYFLRLTPDEDPVETYCQMSLRQAIQFYYKESWEKVVKCYYEIIEKKYVHASPTIFNAGTRKNQMSSCFLLTIGDNLESLLYTGSGDIGLISKMQGGIGVSFSNIRHSSISNTGKSAGAMPFCNILDATIKCVDQGGKRNGAMTITINDWHIDIVDFVRSRDNIKHEGIHLDQSNTCLFVSKLFMERVKNNQNWTLFCPAKAEVDGVRLTDTFGDVFEDLYPKLEKEAYRRENEYNIFCEKMKDVERNANSNPDDEKNIFEYYKFISEKIRMKKNLIDYKVINSKKLYDLICEVQMKSASPFITYADQFNLKNNTINIGKTMSSNLCLEISLPSSEDSISSCNLAHVNLKYFAKGKYSELGMEAYDFKGLGEATASCVENINKVIDYNHYPLDEYDKKTGKVIKQGKISRTNLRDRPIGVGVSGLAEVFAILNIAFDSDEAHYINKCIFASMYFYGLKRSVELSKVRGPYQTFKTGKCRFFVDGEWKTFEGSPFSNGFLQFDLWKFEADYYKSIGRLNEKIYDVNDNIPINPSVWGESATWDDLKEDIKKYGILNSMITTQQPTASSAQQLRNAEITEAHQTLIYSRKLSFGNYTVFSEPFVEDMVRYGMWTKKIIDFVIYSDGSIKYLDKYILHNKKEFPQFLDSEGELTDSSLKLIKHLQDIHKGMYDFRSQKFMWIQTRQSGIYTDQSHSLNIYIAEPNVNKLQAVHMYTNALCLKTGMYYLRSNPASKNGKFTMAAEEQEEFRKILSGEYDIDYSKMVCKIENGRKNCIMCE